MPERTNPSKAFSVSGERRWRKKEYYKKPSTLRREKQKEAEKKAAIQAKKMEKVLNRRDK